MPISDIEVTADTSQAESAIQGLGEKIQSMSTVAAESFSNIMKQASSGDFGGLVTAINPIAGAFYEAAEAVLGFVDNTEKAIIKLDALGQTFGTSAAGMQNLEEEMRGFGISAERIEQFADRFGAKFGAQWSEVAKSLREAKVEAEKVGEAVESAAIKSEKAENKVTDELEKQKEKREDLKDSVAGGQLTEREARRNLQKIENEGPRKDEDWEDYDIRRERAQLALDKAEHANDKLAFQEKTQPRDQELERRENANEQARASTDYQDAKNKEYDQALKDLAEIAKAMRGEPSKVKDIRDVSPQEIIRASQVTPLPGGGTFHEQDAGGALRNLQQFFQKATELGVPRAELNADTRAAGGGRGADSALITEALQKMQPIQEIFSQGAQKVGALGESAVTSAKQFEGAMATIEGAATRFAQQLSTALIQFPTGGAVNAGSPGKWAGGFIRGFDGGGAVFGPGTATSDSIPALLSNGEYVINAASVGKYGLALFDALNSMALGGFALGGGLGLSPIRMAGGGAVSARTTPFNLIIDGHSFSGLTAPENVASKLKSYVVGRQSSSAGIEPSWRR